MTKRPIDPNAIIDAVCERYDIAYCGILSPQRGVASEARAVASYLLYRHCEMSWPQIARRFGRKSHGAFFSGARRVDPSDPELDRIMARTHEIMEECHA